MNERAIRILGASCKWTGRALSLLLLVFWGLFFVEHMKEWFLRPHGPYPPAWVWRQQAFHFLMLVALGVALRWDKLGALLLVLTTAGFFGLMPRWNGFPWIAFLNLAPVVFFAVYWLTQRAAPAAAEQGEAAAH